MFLKHFKNNANKPFNIPPDFKNNPKLMTMELVLYVQVVIIRWKGSNITEENENKNDNKFKFQGQSARSQRWFDIDFYLIKGNVSACKPDLYKKIYQRQD